ncbi:hypothetical protein Q1695_003303 [Nippostrongylus brasiliensis]|nr:hypothetical protein Q1695_003303 [Nippostrongylus brasiliensis]
MPRDAHHVDKLSEAIDKVSGAKNIPKCLKEWRRSVKGDRRGIRVRAGETTRRPTFPAITLRVRGFCSTD